ncbi:MAG: peptidoglycan DD-metalloendopeptidase family protein [Marinovum sp.]|nr:peptidoglycan DD-metalloendopeptidase family protein [Marinovum sp.]
MTTKRTAYMRLGLVAPLVLALAACDEPLDFDLRGVIGENSFDTTDAARNASARRPEPDDRGIISYPNYQVAVARRNDTLTTMGERIGVNPDRLAKFNGIQVDDPLRAGEIIALPSRVSEPSPETGSVLNGPIRPASEVDVSVIAGNAIDSAAPTPVTATALPSGAQTGFEPVRHRVERGETAFTISRLYNVSVRSLAEWNSLDRNFTIREGQFLLIPAAREDAPQSEESSPATPGAGSTTPTPPSAAQPLPAEVPPSQAESSSQEPASAPAAVPASSDARMIMPVQGRIIREYSKGRNEGIDISAVVGASVKAAEGGTVAAITSDADQVPIVVLKHADNVLTVYANVSDIAVNRGDSVSRGQAIAKVRAGDPAYVHFEVREGFESVDPMPYLR